MAKILDRPRLAVKSRPLAVALDRTNAFLATLTRLDNETAIEKFAKGCEPIFVCIARDQDVCRLVFQGELPLAQLMTSYFSVRRYDHDDVAAIKEAERKVGALLGCSYVRDGQLLRVGERVRSSDIHTCHILCFDVDDGISDQLAQFLAGLGILAWQSVSFGPHKVALRLLILVAGIAPAQARHLHREISKRFGFVGGGIGKLNFLPTLRGCGVGTAVYGQRGLRADYAGLLAKLGVAPLVSPSRARRTSYAVRQLLELYSRPGVLERAVAHIFGAERVAGDRVRCIHAGHENDDEHPSGQIIFDGVRLPAFTCYHGHGAGSLTVELGELWYAVTIMAGRPIHVDPDGSHLPDAVKLVWHARLLFECGAFAVADYSQWLDDFARFVAKLEAAGASYFVHNGRDGWRLGKLGFYRDSLTATFQGIRLLSACKRLIHPDGDETGLTDQFLADWLGSMKQAKRCKLLLKSAKLILPSSFVDQGKQISLAGVRETRRDQGIRLSSLSRVRTWYIMPL